MSTTDIETLSGTEDLSASEQAALELIASEGELPQSDLWKALDLSSRGGSRIAKSLAEKGLIGREQTTYEGRVTYLLTPTKTDKPAPTETSTTATTETTEEASQPPGPAQSAGRSRAAREPAAENEEDEGNASIERQSQTAPETHQHHDSPTSERQAATSEEHDLNDREQRALTLIEREGDLPQSELWKALGITSRTGSRVATSLEDQGQIEREQTVYEGQRTYLLSPRRDPADLDFSLLIAGNSLSPFVEEDSLDPITSDAFTQWLLQLANEAQEH